MEFDQPKIDFVEFAELTESQLRDSLANLPLNSAILHLSYFRDPTGAHFSIEKANRIITSFGLPVYSVWEMHLGLGVVGGIVISGFQQGKTAANLAFRILQGEDADAILVLVESPNVPMFDHKQLTKFDITKSKLPAGSIIINQPTSFYKKNKKFYGRAGF